VCHDARMDGCVYDEGMDGCVYDEGVGGRGVVENSQDVRLGR